MPIFGTNPIAVAIPNAEGPPLVLDAASSSIIVGHVVGPSGRGNATARGCRVGLGGQSTVDSSAAHALSPCGALIGTLLATAGGCVDRRGRRPQSSQPSR